MDRVPSVISIASLIYKSTNYADSTWDSLHENTPYLRDRRAEFFFIANDASEEVIAHLKKKHYPYFIQNNKVEDLEGFAPPLHIRRIYMGYNRALKESREQTVLINSDLKFSPGWLESLYDLSTPDKIVCSKLVERAHPKYGKFHAALHGEFGENPETFKKDEFLKFINPYRANETQAGGAYGPCMLFRSKALEAGLYPEGNPVGTTGDKAFFAKLKEIGVEHITSWRSIVYHFKEGEMAE